MNDYKRGDGGKELLEMFKLSELQSRPNSAVYQTLFRLQLYASGYMLERVKKYGDGLQKSWSLYGVVVLAEPWSLHHIGAFEDQKTVRSFSMPDLRVG